MTVRHGGAISWPGTTSKGKQLLSGGPFRGAGQFTEPGHLGLELAGFLLQGQDPADAGQVQPVGGQRADLGEPVDVPAGVTASAARASVRA